MFLRTAAACTHLPFLTFFRLWLGSWFSLHKSIYIHTYVWSWQKVQYFRLIVCELILPTNGSDLRVTATQSSFAPPSRLRARISIQRRSIQRTAALEMFDRHCTVH